MTEKTKEVSTYVEPEKKRLIRMAAASDDVSMSEFLYRLVDEELTKRIEEGNSTRPPAVPVMAD